MLDRQMLELKNEVNLQPLRRSLADREPHRIDNPFLRQARTGVRVSKIACFQFLIAEHVQLVSGRLA